MVTPLWDSVRRSLWGAGLVAALLGVAIMGHGSSVFGVLPLALIAACRGLPELALAGHRGLVGIAVVVPWSAYQSYGDPPGNRLTKWMLAGVTEVDDRGTGETILDSYGEAGVGGTIHNKAENFAVMAGGGPACRGHQGLGRGDGFRRPAATAWKARGKSSSSTCCPRWGCCSWHRSRWPWLAAAGPPGGAEWSFALTCFAIFAAGAIGLGLLLFGDEPSRAVIHVGSYLVPIVGICGAVAGLRASFPRFALYYVGAGRRCRWRFTFLPSTPRRTAPTRCSPAWSPRSASPPSGCWRCV